MEGFEVLQEWYCDVEDWIRSENFLKWDGKWRISVIRDLFLWGDC